MHTAIYADRKSSGSAWLGEIPAHWGVKKLKFLATVQPSNVDKKFVEGEVPVILCNYTDVYKNEFIDGSLDFMQASATEAEIKKFKVDVGDVIVTKDSESPEDIAVPACIAEQVEGLVCGYHLTQIKPIDLEGRYLFRLFQSKGFNAQFIVAANGVTRFGLPQFAIANAVSPLPPLEEQKTIAHFLDYKTAQIDALIAKQKTLLDKLAEKRTALISHAVTKGLDLTVPMKASGVEWLGEIPAHWVVLPLRRLIQTVKTGTTPAGVNELHFSDSGMPWFRPGDFPDQVFIESAEKRLSEDGVSEVRIFPAFTVMHVGIGATIGKVGVTTEPSSCNQQINAIVCNERLHHLFAAYFLQSIKEYIVKCGKYTTLPIINQDETKALSFTVPPLDEQVNITAYLLREERLMDQRAKKISQVISKLQEYRSALITNAVTGKIDVRHIPIPMEKAA